MIFVVTGMHKSGTTLVAKCLHASGVSMVEDDVGDRDYDHGSKYERPGAVDVNAELLNGCFYPSPFAPVRRLARRCLGRTSTLRSHPSRSVLRRMPTSQTAQQRKRMNDLIADCGACHDHWGFKDPRTCLTYPLWRSELPPHRLVFVYRDYNEVISHYGLAGWKRANLARLYTALHAWVVYNETMMRNLDPDGSRWIAISYRDLMTGNEELERLSRFIGLPLIDVRAARLYRNRLAAQKQKRPVSVGLVTRFLPRDPELTSRDLERLRRHQVPVHAM